METPGTFGDFLTLIAASEYFGVRVYILTALEGPFIVTVCNIKSSIHYIILFLFYLFNWLILSLFFEYKKKYKPKQQKQPNIILLSHWAEMYWGSLVAYSGNRLTTLKIHPSKKKFVSILSLSSLSLLLLLSLLLCCYYLILNIII